MKYQHYVLGLQTYVNCQFHIASMPERYYNGNIVLRFFKRDIAIFM